MKNTINPLEIAQKFNGQTVRYMAEKATVTESGVRIFKIKAVEAVATNKKSGAEYVTALVVDFDDCGAEKFRTLRLENIDLIA